MEDDLPTEYDVVVVGTGIDFYHDVSPVILVVMIFDRYDRVHRRRGGKQDRQEGSASGQVTTSCLISFPPFPPFPLHLSSVNHTYIIQNMFDI